VIIGSGSAWFEMVRHTTELLPLAEAAHQRARSVSVREDRS